ncbi:molybdopterin biosynthesis protein [Halomarina halobia]|uniref:Molybdopterin biosynthesis protein n=1 Tax=Halomarina halobia TaxID=3033386 RepID=A0ABD6A7J5_9EURY|nr:molybdopterin biosynthesis protein [Halomarina sp. PSR21]
MRKEFRDLAPPEAAHEAIASLDLAAGTEEIPLRDARGRVLAERVDAALDVPGFDRATVDGYAVRARDTFGADEADPAVLDLAGVVHAGTEPDVVVGEGECAEISTGAVLPEGANAVVMVERTSERDGAIEIRTGVAPGDRVMFAGADVAAGERALGPGTRLTPREIGLLSALGVEEVPVRATPTVGIVSTGDELVRPGEPLSSAAGEIYDVNSYTIATGVEEAGGEAVLYPHAGDDYDQMERLLVRAAEECDLVLSSGSTSASAVDVIYRVVEEQGELLLHGVAVKPGKPMLVGRLERSAYVGLPGYPVSALTIFSTFVAPAIRRAAGVPEPAAATVEGRMATRERYAEGRLRLMPVGLVESGPTRSVRDGDDGDDGADGAGETLVYPVDKGSGATTSLVEADGIVEMHPDTGYLDAGERVEVRLFSPDVRTPALFAVGEDDPALSRMLDRVDRPRFIAFGSREGLRRLRNGVPDVAVTTTGGAPGFETVELGSWTREWGLVVPAGNPDGVTDLADLVDRDLRFVNRTSASGLRTSLTAALADLAEERGASRHDLVDGIDGFEAGVRAHESPARKVLAGDADVGLGLRATAARLDVDFVPVGTETVRAFSTPDRAEKPAVRALAAAIDDGDAFDDLPGYEG